VIAKSAAQGTQVFGKDGFVPLGQKEWAAMLRKLDREDPGYGD
jgi:hypothetical protein